MRKFVEGLQNEKHFSVAIPQFQFKIDKESKDIRPKMMTKNLSSACLTKRYVKPEMSATRTFPWGLAMPYESVNNRISDFLWRRQRK